ncbi:hypothetical protein RUM43_014803 [Polyplax serrata]|uniref:Uncharacterized protein n=1 Tax=Polyplax serrata TaxID=468196 RepID=A0AAN8Q1X0_POLSC
MLMISLLGQQQQFHAFAFGQRPFIGGHFGNPLDPLQRAADPLAFRMPAMPNCQNMSQFGLSAGNAHWGYSAATPYSSYLGSGALASCGAGGFNPSLGFSASGDQSSVGHDTFASSTAVSSILPDTTGSGTGLNVTGDLEQQLGGLVSSHQHQNQINQQQSERTSSGSSSGLLVPRYPGSADYGLGTRSLSDSSAGESPVGDDLLGVNTTTANSFSCSAAGSFSQYSSSGSNLYLGTPVLPASLLYSQLYNAANQNHAQFHHLHHHHHHHHTSTADQDLQTVMDHLNPRQSSEDQTRLGTGGVQRTVHSAADTSGVWRPY